MEADAERLMAASAGWRLSLIAESFARLTGGVLIAPDGELWSAPLVVLAHGRGADPVFFYGNRAALQLFETTAEDLLRMPSRTSAEPAGRAERARLLDEVAARGFIDDYAGVRISARGRRFRIERATVWNLVDGAGDVHGQAAAFASWARLD